MKKMVFQRGRAALVGAVVSVFALTLAACSSGTPSADNENGELTPVSVAATMSIGQGALFLGIDEGFFENEGLKVETVPVANPPASLAAVQSGQVDFGYAPSIPLLNALSQGIPVRVVGAADGLAAEAIDSDAPETFDDTGLYVAADSGIESIEDLKGKRVAVPARKAQHEVTIANELVNAGLEPTDVEWVALDYTSAIAALNGGSVDAAGLVSPFTSTAEAAGAHRIASPAIGFFEEGAIGLWTVGATTAENKPEVVEAFTRAMEKANAYANEHPKEAIEFALKNSDSDLDIDEVVIPYWPEKVTTTELERVNMKLSSLGFLTEPVDLAGVIVE